ncbi:hypothetical protein IWQ60_002152 [Tieghemiomyces parasiticus]|uniref:Transcription factor domain-containing protein n=1 Tax=Tieghemiomyces parasiticus TaxID=78921 RepID=A0A9W8ABT5_9FUNG|nr:hypothetical protein IWQ60_002152 [Tieghemiomyces parasiticus]
MDPPTSPLGPAEGTEGQSDQAGQACDFCRIRKIRCDRHKPSSPFHRIPEARQGIGRRLTARPVTPTATHFVPNVVPDSAFAITPDTGLHRGCRTSRTGPTTNSARKPAAPPPITDSDSQASMEMKRFLLSHLEQLETLLRQMDPWRTGGAPAGSDNLSDLRGGELLSSTESIEQFFGIERGPAAVMGSSSTPPLFSSPVTPSFPASTLSSEDTSLGQGFFKAALASQRSSAMELDVLPTGDTVHSSSSPSLPQSSPDATALVNLLTSATLPSSTTAGPEPARGLVPWTPAMLKQYAEGSPTDIRDDPAFYLMAKIGFRFWNADLRLSYESVFNGQPLPIPRSLYLPTDLLYHTDVLDHLLFLFCRLLYPVGNELHYHRLLVRHRQGHFLPALRLAISMVISPVSTHAVFQNIPPHLAGVAYYEHLRDHIMSVIESDSLDACIVLMIVAEYELGQGRVDSSFSLLSAGIRKMQSWRIHIMDHPHPPPNNDPTGTRPDLVQADNEFLRENFRIKWWGVFGQDVVGALVFGQLPVIQVEDMYVNLPTNGVHFGALAMENLGDFNSPFYTDPTYPSVLTRPMSRYHTERNYFDLRVISHRVAQLRYYRGSDPLPWFNERAHLNQQLEGWMADCQEDFNPSLQHHFCALGSNRIYREFLIFSLHVRIMYHMTAIFLNHTGDLDPWPFTPPAEGPLAQLDPDGAVRAECRERCWQAVRELRRVIEKSMTVPNFFQNTLFLGAFYAAAVICIETIQYSEDAERVEWARMFVQEIIDFLSQFGQLWITNLKAVQTIKDLQASTNIAKRLTLTLD